jgi:hypothetical protein
MTIEEKINALPREAKNEVLDFIDYLMEKSRRDEKQWMIKLSKKSIDKIWDNPEDDVYSEPTKREVNPIEFRQKNCQQRRA